MAVSTGTNVVGAVTLNSAACCHAFTNTHRTHEREERLFKREREERLFKSVIGTCETRGRDGAETKVTAITLTPYSCRHLLDPP